VASGRLALRVVADHLDGSAVATGCASAVATRRGRRLGVVGGVALVALVVAGRVAGRQLLADVGHVVTRSDVAPQGAVAPRDLVRLAAVEAAVRLGVAAVRVSAASGRPGLRAGPGDLRRSGVSTGCR